MTPLPDDAALRALLEQATPDEWAVTEYINLDVIAIKIGDNTSALVTLAKVYGDDRAALEATAALIVQAPDLAAEVLRLRSDLAANALRMRRWWPRSRRSASPRNSAGWRSRGSARKSNSRRNGHDQPEPAQPDPHESRK